MAETEVAPNAGPTDAAIRQLAEFTCSLDLSGLPISVRHQAVRRIIDTVGCGLAGIGSEPARIGAKIAARAAASQGATILGTNHRTLPELAAFANSIASRCLEGNDCFAGGGGHPSDMILPLLAVAEAEGCHGSSLVLSVVIAYEIHWAAFQSLGLRERGLDHVFYSAVGAAAGTARLLGLNAEQTENALALAVVPNLALEVSRRGNLSMWKSSAAANAVRNGLFAAYLARHGMTGPTAAIYGEHGLLDLIAAKDFSGIHPDRTGWAVELADTKAMLTEFHSQAPILVALDLAKKISSDEIESLTVHTYHFAWSETANDRSRWRPKDRSTADHSLPFTVAAVLANGSFSDSIYEEEQLSDPRILALVDRIRVVPDTELSAAVPENFGCRIDLLAKDGRELSIGLANPPGHHNSPLTDVEIEDKFKRISTRNIDPVAISEILGFLWDIETQSDISRLFRLTHVRDEECLGHKLIDE